MKDKILKIFSSSIKIKVTGRNINNFLKRLINNNINIEKVIPISHKEIDLIINYQDLDKVLKLKTIYNIKIVRYYGKLRIIKRIKKDIFILSSLLISLLLIYTLSNIIFKIEVIHSNNNIIKLVEDDLLRLKIAEAGWNRARSYTWERSFEKFVAAIKVFV